jgi:predicted secreted protein
MNRATTINPASVMLATRANMLCIWWTSRFMVLAMSEMHERRQNEPPWSKSISLYRLNTRLEKTPVTRGTL